MKIRMYEGERYYSFNGSNFYNIEADALPEFERLNMKDVMEYSVKDFLTELFSEGEKRLRNCVSSEYYNFYIMLYLGMRLCCIEDVDIIVPDIVMDYLNHLHSKHKSLYQEWRMKGVM